MTFSPSSGITGSGDMKAKIYGMNKTYIPNSKADQKRKLGRKKGKKKK
jgi:hypothetical protein